MSNQARKRIEEIHHSFGYKFVRYYASKIDRLFPDGTSRGEFRKVVTASLRIIMEEGLRNFWEMAMEKIKLHEFRIIDPSLQRISRPTSFEFPKRGRDATELSDEYLLRNLKEFLSTEGAALEFGAGSNPVVSIIVVTYNKAKYTYQCLQNLLRGSLPPHEAIIVDNASTDDTPALLTKTRGTRVIMNRKNQFFASACNQGSRVAKGKYLLFLNNDAFVGEGAVSSLVETMDSAEEIGAAGAKLVWRNGLLQEAGSIIWRDGSALGYGRGDDPSKPEYCYARDVDYCSAACLMVRRDVFESLGGFDESFSPAYYEDTDLCMKIWAAGYRVVYDPHAIATHIEYAGTSFHAAKVLMGKQRSLFVEKYKEALEKHYPFSEGNVLKARSRRRRPTILVIDDCVPKPSEGSGYPRMFSMLTSMARLGYPVTFFPLTDGTPKQPETDVLAGMGVEVLWGRATLRDVLQYRRGAYDTVLISRPHNALFAMGVVKENNPQAKIVYDAEALWHRREQMRVNLGLSARDHTFQSEEAEFSIIRSADYVICVSDMEKRLVEQKLGKQGKVMLWGHSHRTDPTQNPFEKRSGLLFVGGFKSSPAHNDDAVIYFVKTMLPRIRERISDCRLMVAGSNPPKSVRRLASESVMVKGYVRDLKELYEKCRVFVAPIRFGAGTMWKVTEAMSYGLPCVLSAVAAQGLKATDGQEALVAQDEEDFIEKTVRLYQEGALWNQIRKCELEYIAKNCNPTTMEKSIDDFLKEITTTNHIGL